MQNKLMTSVCQLFIIAVLVIDTSLCRFKLTVAVSAMINVIKFVFWPIIKQLRSLKVLKKSEFFVSAVL